MTALFWLLAVLAFADTVLADPCDTVECQYGGTCTVNSGGAAVCNCVDGTSGAFCEIPCPAGWIFFERTTDCYGYSATQLTYDGATQACQGLGGFVATAKTPEEFSFLFAIWPGGRDMWLGMTRTDGGFIWADGDPVTYANWAAGQPGVGGCANVLFNRFWYSVGCNDGVSPFFCQIPSHPCYSVECQNDGTCELDSNDEAVCVCAEGFSGERCEIDACDGYCQSNGLCTLSAGVPACECPTGYSGDQCTNLDIVNVTPCSEESSCPNGLDCIPVYLPCPKDGPCVLNGIATSICLPGKCQDCDRLGVCENKGKRVHCCDEYPGCLP